MRKDAFNSLESLLKSHNDPAVAMGDFNVTSEEELELNTFQQQSGERREQSAIVHYFK